MTERAPLLAQHVASDLFASYGHVLDLGKHPETVNAGFGQRHNLHYELNNARPAARLRGALFQITPRSPLITLDRLESHPDSAQTIIPVKSGPYPVVVCQRGHDGEPDLETLSAFVFKRHQGVNYFPGIWHMPLMSIKGTSVFFVQSWQDGSSRDCIETEIPPIPILFDKGSKARSPAET